ncbi:MAG: gliding motility-associated C-terminal domain-containing protein [Cyclobacteriaceae bacterium]
MPKLHRLFFALVLLPASFSAVAQCSEWDKLLHYKYAILGDAAHDRFGNVYVVGSYFTDGFTLGSNTFTLPVGGAGAFIAKFDKNNSLVWATSPSTGYRAFAREIEVDANDNVVVAGDFDTSVSFECITLQGSGRSDIFVVNFMQDGTPVWATASTGVDDSGVAGLSMSPNGNIILIATFVEKSDVTRDLTEPDVTMGGVPVKTGAVDQVNAGYDSFIAAIRPDGTVAWTQGIGGDGNEYDYVCGVATDSANNVIVTGFFSSPQISFDGHIVHKFAVSENYFLAKINPEGQTLWVRETEGGINQSGWGVATDPDHNIFVAGRFYGDAKFGLITLQGKGDADVFVAKFTPEGTNLNAISIGNDNFDAGSDVEVNSKGQVLVSAYYNSNYLEIGSFSSSKLDLSLADSFIATLSNDLTTVECARFITGDGESVVWDFELDPFDNTIVRVDRGGMNGATQFDSQIVTDPDYFSVIAILGNNPATDEGETPGPGFPNFSLGKDSTLCIGQKLSLSVQQFCNAAYKWNTGSTSPGIEVTHAGVYWVDVTWKDNTVRDEISISYYEPLVVSLGHDQAICPGGTITWTLPVYVDATYRWSDGKDSHKKTATLPATYWVETSNRCETVRDTVMLQIKSPAVVDLGSDIVACKGADVTLHYTAAAGETLLWSDGSTTSSLSATQSGTYNLTVNNGCIDTTDEVEVTIMAPGEVEIPNVVTHNGDEKNDRFLLPHDVQNCSLLICNRWGEKVFYAQVYENNWPQGNISPGVYFYTMRADCIPESKGTIHLVD